MRFALVTDAWRPQVNGVARTLAALSNELVAAGHEVVPLTPNLFRTVPCPMEPEVRLAVRVGRRLARRLEALAPDAMHIATEGPLGHAARSYCIKHNFRFTTAYHTRYPEYLRARFGIPSSWT
ncbi:MAG: glycosyltransferase, partial [Alphaproteobacteria bacterium]|nr:glycosyltransferase [Alphaproteobacteria bacterium]